MFNECIARHDKSVPRSHGHSDGASFVQKLLAMPDIILWGAHLPAANAEKESQDIGLLLFVKLLHVFERTHLIPKGLISHFSSSMRDRVGPGGYLPC